MARKYAVPKEIRDMRPEGTTVKAIVGHYYVCTRCEYGLPAAPHSSVRWFTAGLTNRLRKKKEPVACQHLVYRMRQQPSYWSLLLVWAHRRSIR